MMYSIGEFAAFGRVSARMLRHYDAIGLLKPAHTDDRSGYRSYGAGQLPDLYRIADLRYLGVGLTAISDVMNSDDREAAVRDVLRERRSSLMASIDADTARLSRLERLIAQEEEPLMHQRTEYSPADPATVYETSGVVLGGEPVDIQEAIPALLVRLDSALEAAGRPLIEPGIFWYVPVDGWDDVEVHVSYTAEAEAVSGDGYEVTRLPAASTMARLRHHGDMTVLDESWGALMSQVVADGYAMSGPLREVYLEAPGHIPGDGWITELQVPVERRDAS